jgi:monoamine oxidase
VSEGKPIVVIGAGAAGLSAANHLLQSGREVVVLEANDYIGGRIKSHCCADGEVVELGASLIHHRKGYLRKVAENKKALGRRKSSMRFLLNGKPHTEFSLLRQIKFLDMFRIRKVFHHLYSYRGDDVGLAHLLDLAKLSENTKKLFFGMYSSALGTDMNNVGINSLRYSYKRARLRAERDVVAEEVAVEFISLLSEYVDAVSANVRLNSVVTDVNYHVDGITVVLKDGEELLAEQVVVTVPLSILKNNKIRFFRSLPAAKQEAIDALGVGAAAKLVLDFSNAFWGEKVSHLIGCGSEVTFFVASGSANRLIAYVYGEQLLQQDDETVCKAVLAQLDENYSSQASASFDSFYMQNWLREEYIAGGYSFDAIGSEGSRERLAEPVFDRIHFAGEATIDGYSASVEGAVMSGERAAKEVLALLQ